MIEIIEFVPDLNASLTFPLVIDDNIARPEITKTQAFADGMNDLLIGLKVLFVSQDIIIVQACVVPLDMA